MNRLALVLFLLAPLSLRASTTLFTGTLTNDDQTAAIVFTVITQEIVTIQSFGYSGGTVNSTVIPAGGFAPSVFVFDNLGDFYTEDSTDNDPLIQGSFAAGTYEAVIAVSGNRPNDNFLADGFTEDGAGSFTCALFGKSGSFCDDGSATGDQRTGDWAFAVTGADSVEAFPTPEPASYGLMGIGAATALFLRRRRQAAR
jgi:PEP-CTERM motif